MNSGSSRAVKVRRYAAEIRQLAAVHGASGIYLVGSVATGQDRDATELDPGSDVDFLVPSFVGDHTIEQLVRLERDLGDLLDERVQVHRGDGIGAWDLGPDVRVSMAAQAIDLRALP